MDFNERNFIDFMYTHKFQQLKHTKCISYLGKLLHTNNFLYVNLHLPTKLIIKFEISYVRELHSNFFSFRSAYN